MKNKTSALIYAIDLMNFSSEIIDAADNKKLVDYIIKNSGKLKQRLSNKEKYYSASDISNIFQGTFVKKNFIELSDFVKKYYESMRH